MLRQGKYCWTGVGGADLEDSSSSNKGGGGGISRDSIGGLGDVRAEVDGFEFEGLSWIGLV